MVLFAIDSNKTVQNYVRTAEEERTPCGSHLMDYDQTHCRNRVNLHTDRGIFTGDTA